MTVRGTTPHFGECTVCRQGVVIPVAYLGDSRIFLMCDDCESFFTSPGVLEDEGDGQLVRDAKPDE